MPRPSELDQRLILGLSLAQLITWGSVFYTFALLVEPIERDLGLGRAQTALAFSLALLVEGFCALRIGRWIDQGQERLVMTGGSLLVGCCLLLHGAITAPWMFYAVWALLGVGMSATLYAPVFAVVTRRFPDQFRRGIITMTFLGGLASTVFIPLSGWLIAAAGWRHALWWLAALHFLVCAPLHAWLLRGAPPGHAAGPARAAGTDFRQHLRSAPFLLIGVFVVLVMGVTSALPAHMVSLLRENGLSQAWAITVPASIGLVQVVGRALLYFFEHHVDVHTTNRVIPCLLPAGLACLLAAPWLAGWIDGGPLALTLLFVLLYGLGNGMVTIVKGTVMAQYIDRHHVASLNGALGVPTALARAVAPLMLGVLWTREAGYSHGLMVLLALGILAVAALMQAQRLALRRAR
ncbi:MAG: MFS transporter [Rhodoferax sp.]|nr:MFS transporter [Rhodoferax sp.]